MLAINVNLTAEQRLSKAVVDIMGNPKYVALAGVLMIGERSVTRDKAPTACTDGKNEWYNPDFIDTLSDAELRFLVLHEVYHKLYRHLTTWQHLYKQHPQLANIACDYVINIKISDDNPDRWAVMPQGGYLDEKYRGWDSAQVFKDIYDNDDQPDGGPSTGQGFDEHDWDGAQEMTADEQRELARELDEAVRQGALVAGKTGSGGDRDLAELLQPQVDWCEVMQQFIVSHVSGNDSATFARPSRRFAASGYYMPSGISETMAGLVIACDMSGSIGQREQSICLTEAHSAVTSVRPDWVRILYWDTQVCGDELYEDDQIDDMVYSTKPQGGGGTTLSCVPKYISDNNITPQAIIVVTDGYIGSDWGQWSCPVLFVVIDNPSCKADTGITLNVNSRDM